MATIRDIARMAGVSHGTVTNVLNGNGNVRAEKIRAVMDAAEKLGYTVNLRAKSLREGRSHTLAAVVPNLQDRAYADFVTSFQYHAEKAGFKSCLYVSNGNLEREKELMRQVHSSAPHGVAVITCYDGEQDIYAEDHALYVGHQPGEGCDFLGFDAEACGRLMGERAAQYGQVAFIADCCMYSFQRGVTKAFAGAVAGTPGCHVREYRRASFTQDAALAMSVLSAEPAPQAVFVTSYELAQCIRSIARTFFSLDALPIYTASPMFTLPEDDFVKLELDYRLLGCEAVRRLIEEGRESAPRGKTLPCEGFRSWNPPAVSAPVKLSIATLDSPAAQILVDMARYYTRATGTEISVQVYPYDVIHELLCSLNDESTLDILRMDATWLSWFGPRVFEPLESIRPDIRRDMERLIPGIAGQYGEIGGKLYAYPETPSPQILFYRRDLFENTMIQRQYKERCREELRPPQSFEEYNRIAAYFTRELNPDSPVAHGSTLTLGNTGVAATEYLTRYFSLTSRLFDDEGSILLESPEGVRAMELLAMTPRFAPSSPSAWWRETAKRFAQGDIAMTILFSNYASEMIGPASRIHTKIGYAMLPGGNPLLGGGVMGCCRTSRHKQEAVDFIRWYCSEEVSSATTLLGSVSPCRRTYENYQLLDTYPWLSLTQRCFDASHVERVPANAQGGFDERRFLSILGTAVLQVLNGALTPAQAMHSAAERYQRELRGAAPGRTAIR